MKQQVSKICQSAYLELRRISSVRHVLTVDATKPLVTSLVLSCLDYCNSLLSGIPQQLIDKHQKVQNCSARLIFKTSKYTHVSPLLSKLHWLPIAKRIDYKISSLYCLWYCSTVLVWSPSPLRPVPFTAFLCWHPHLSDFNTKEKVPRAACFLPSQPCHLE